MNENNWAFNRRHHYFAWLAVAFAIVAISVIAVIGVSTYFFATRLPAYPAYGYHIPFFFPFGLIFGLFFIFLVFGAIRWVFWSRRGWGWGYGYRGRYRGYGNEYYILRQRYARGEITKEQFEQMTNELKQHEATGTPGSS